MGGGALRQCFWPPPLSLSLAQIESTSTVPKKLSEIVKKMATIILRKKDASDEAISIALQMTHIAWNYADEEYRDEPGYIQGIQELNQLIPPVKKEFITDNAESLIDTLMKYKKKHHRGDKRAIFFCEYKGGNVKVTWRQ